MKKNVVLLVVMLATVTLAAAPALAQTEQEVPAGSVDGATLFALVVGVLLMAGGVAIRRIFGKS